VKNASIPQITNRSVLTNAGPTAFIVAVV